MSHYNVNGGVPKTLIQHLIRWVISSGAVRRRGRRDPAVGPGHRDHPRAGPADEDEEIQSSEAKVGPYVLQDFSLFHVLRYGFRPSKIAFLAWHAWRDAEGGRWPVGYPPDKRPAYSLAEIRHWLVGVRAAVLLVQPVQALRDAQRAQGVRRWIALPARGLARPVGHVGADLARRDRARGPGRLIAANTAEHHLTGGNLGRISFVSVGRRISTGAARYVVESAGRQWPLGGAPRFWVGTAWPGPILGKWSGASSSTSSVDRRRISASESHAGGTAEPWPVDDDWDHLGGRDNHHRHHAIRVVEDPPEEVAHTGAANINRKPRARRIPGRRPRESEKATAGNTPPRNTSEKRRDRAGGREDERTADRRTGTGIVKSPAPRSRRSSRRRATEGCRIGDYLSTAVADDVGPVRRNRADRATGRLAGHLGPAGGGAPGPRRGEDQLPPTIDVDNGVITGTNNGTITSPGNLELTFTVVGDPKAGGKVNLDEYDRQLHLLPYTTTATPGGTEQVQGAGGREDGA